MNLAIRMILIKRKTLLIILPCILFQYISFGQDWIGYGKGVSHISIEGDIISGISCESKVSLKADSILIPGTHACYLFDDETGETKLSGNLVSWGKGIDSIKIHSLKGGVIESYYNKENYSIKREYDFEGLELEIWNDQSDAVVSYQINKKGNFHVQNENFKTLANGVLSKSEMDSLNKLLSSIDIYGLGECKGDMSMIHWSTWTYTFFEWDRKYYQYRTQRVPKRLLDLTAFIRNLK